MMALVLLTLLIGVCPLEADDYLIPIKYSGQDLCVHDKVTVPTSEVGPCPNNSLCSWCNNDTAYCGVHNTTKMVLNIVPPLPESVRYLYFSSSAIYMYGAGGISTSAISLGDPTPFKNAAMVTHLSLANRKFRVLTGKNRSFTTFDMIKNLTCFSINNWQFDIVSYPKPKQVMEILMPFLRYILTIPTLRQFSAAGCGLSELVDAKNTSVETLVLSSNPMSDVLEMSVLCSYHNLTELFLDNCGVKHSRLNCTLRQLRKLDLSRNHMVSLQFKSFDDSSEALLPNLQFLNLSWNNLVSFGFDLTPLPLLELLDFSGKTVNKLPHIPIYIPGKFSPKIVSFVINSVTITCLTCDWERKLKIEDFVCSSSLLASLSLANIDIDFSDTSHDKRILPFVDCPNISTLHLDGNDFLQVDEERFLNLFGSLKRLQVLSMRRCQLEESVPLSVLAAFPDMRSLDLSENRILCVPDGAFDSLRSFRSLDLSKNQIRTISEDAFSDDVRERLVAFSLVDNYPLSCSCDILWLKQWMTTNPTAFFSPGTSRNVHKCRQLDCRAVLMEELVLQPQACLFSRHVNIFIILSCSLIVLILLIVMVVFRYRWHIRLLLHEAFRGQNNVRLLRLLAGTFDYDLFVSYASEDLHWVYEDLLPELEGRLGLKLCIHERDFIPGQNIVDNIVQCVGSSKKIVMVFSKHFVRSQWCQFELTYCLRHVMDYDDVLIVVCIDDVASRDVTSAMMAVMKTTTYIQWGDEAEAEQSFWGRLKLALNDVFEHTERQL